MVVSIANLIKDYAEIGDPKNNHMPELNKINAALVKCFTGIDWDEVPRIKEGTRLQIGYRSRNVYLSKERGIAAKLSSCVYAKPAIPCAEQLASDICALLFGGSEIPKTTIIHETEMDLPKYSEYQPLMYCFLTGNLKKGFPITFIFQSLVPGKTLPFEVEQWHEWDKEQHKTSLSSYQKAFLLVLLLGKKDALGNNSMHDPKTGRFYEIDNENIGKGYYEARGALHHFSSLKLEPLSKDVLEDFLKVEPKDLGRLIEKSKFRNLQLAGLWEKEASFKKYENLQESLKTVQINICSRFGIMQRICCSLIDKEEPVTLKQIEDSLEIDFGMHKNLDRDRQAIADQDQIYLKKYLEKTQS